MAGSDRLNPGFSLEENGDTIKLTLTSPSSGKVFEVFNFNKEQLIGYDEISIDAGLGLNFDISEMLVDETNATYQRVPEVILELQFQAVTQFKKPSIGV